ncbi:uncharacterized protein LOC121628739 isoform X2 [Melanotaenia boesemani]|uniref:uncharacterized protein LOC121628739 isoform X2 n=1 Tax=Melanotaenia boesemani TaxID=1250792 RepID=UPI001C03BB5C|nr:uncharacterized protein LOC121628739 isoform X2 [Melanotaenia boesemani]
MSEDITLWVSQCVACQASTVKIKQEVSQPFELLGMDLVGKLKTTSDGYQYICVLIDYYTKWPQAYPLKTKSAEEVTKCLLKFVYQFEAPKRVLTDQGKEFVNEINKKVCKMLGIQRSLCAPYHPQTNGLVERMNGTIQRALSKLVQSKPEEWEKHLDAVLFGLRTKRQVTTKLSPYFMMFGREARYPTEIPEDYRVDNSVEENLSIEEATENIVKRDEAIQAVLSSKSIPKSTKCKVEATHKFDVGMKVWRLNPRRQRQKGGKLDQKFLGPYTIVSISGKSVDLKDSQGVITTKINTDHLMCYKEEKPRVPRKCKEVSLTTAVSESMLTTPVSSLQPAPPVSSSHPATPEPSSHPATPEPSSHPATPEPSSHPDKPEPSSRPATPGPSSHPATPEPSSHPATPEPSSHPATPEPSSHPDKPEPSSRPATPEPSSHPDKPEPSSRPATPGPSSHPATPEPSSHPATPEPSSRPATPVSIVTPTSSGPNPSGSGFLNCTLDPSVVKNVKDAWEGENSGVLVSKIGPYKLFFGDIFNTAPQRELESEIDPVLYKYVLGIVNESHHWMLVVMLPGEKRSLFLDPLGESTSKINHCKDISRSFMRLKGLNASRWKCDTVSHPIQKDATSCGVYALKFAECILSGLPVAFDNSVKTIHEMREQIAICLLENTDDLTELCHLCGLVNGDTHWIGCDLCPRWYHRNCLKKKTRKKFVCEVCQKKK